MHFCPTSHQEDEPIDDPDSRFNSVKTKSLVDLCDKPTRACRRSVTTTGLLNMRRKGRELSTIPCSVLQTTEPLRQTRVTCAPGLAPYIKIELEALGYETTSMDRMGVELDATTSDAMKLNLH